MGVLSLWGRTVYLGAYCLFEGAVNLRCAVGVWATHAATTPTHRPGAPGGGGRGAAGGVRGRRAGPRGGAAAGGGRRGLTWAIGNWSLKKGGCMMPAGMNSAFIPLS